MSWAGAPYLSVNVAGAQLEQEGFVEEVACALRSSGLVSSRLVLEVTESSLVGDDSAERLQALRKLGIRLAIDDFGTGYSSLSYLRRFPMDVLKIDRSFTRDACEDSALLHAIVAMGESLGLVLVPEGIESEDQADALRALGCRLGQGFLFGKPVPAEELRGVATRPALPA
jgi:EAL domain-containing protein (putative c-di-GMP-specific phosphodiesterase class I)